MNKSLILLIITTLLSSAYCLPYEDQIALANSLQVGRDEDPSAWGCSGCNAANKPIHTYIVEQPVKDVKAIVSVYAQHTVLGFRYTATLKNVWQDLLFAIQHSCDGCKVQKQYEVMWNSIREYTINSLKKHDLTKRLIITGISLGGGLAELSFVDIQASRLFNDVQVTTWGAPRVGNKKWVDWINLHKVTQRFFIKSDPIAALPVCLGLFCNYKQPFAGISCDTKSEACTCTFKETINKEDRLEAASNFIKIVNESKDNTDQDLGSIIDHVVGYKTLYDCTVRG